MPSSLGSTALAQAEFSLCTGEAAARDAMQPGSGGRSTLAQYLVLEYDQSVPTRLCRSAMA